MRKFFMLAGWMIAFAVSGAAVILELKLQEARNKQEAELNHIVALERQLLELMNVQEDVKAQSEEMTKKLVEMVSSLEKLKAMLLEQQRVSPKSLDNPVEDEKPLARGTPVEGNHEEMHKDEPAEFSKALNDLFNGENGDAMVKMGADMSVNMLYGQLFNDLQLPANVADQAKDIISIHMASQMKASLKLLSSNEVEKTRIVEEQKNAEKQLRDELASMLTPNELTLYDQYQEQIPRNSLELNYDIQLKMTGASMSPETSDLIKRSMVDEILAVIPDYGKFGSASTLNPQSTIDLQMAAIGHVRERLQDQLDSDQFAMADQFLKQQGTQLQLAQEMWRKKSAD